MKRGGELIGIEGEVGGEDGSNEREREETGMKGEQRNDADGKRKRKRGKIGGG